MKRILYYLIAVFLLEIGCYYLLPNFTYVIFRVIGHFIIFFYFVNSVKRLTFFDTLIALNLFLLVFSPFFSIFFQKPLSKTLELSMIVINNVILAIAFLGKSDRKVFQNGEKILLKIFLPYIIVPILYALVVIMPSTKGFELTPFLSVFILIVVAVSSAYLSSNRLVTVYIMVSTALFILSGGSIGYKFFVSNYLGDYAFMRLTTLFSKYFLAMGFIEHNKHLSNL